MANAKDIAENLRREVANAARAMVLEIDKQLRKATPVDTGHARRNWVPSVTSPHTGEADSDADHAQGIAEVMRYTLDQGALWVSNTVPYINRLNYGHSQQAPSGFVERAVDVAVQAVRQRYEGRGIDVSDMANRVRSQLGAAGAENLASAYNPMGGDA